MLTAIRTGKFKKEFVLAEKRHKNIDKLIEVMGMIISEELLPPECHNHPLHGKYQGKWECHVEPNWLLVYCIDQSHKEVTFYRTGTHSDLY